MHPFVVDVAVQQQVQDAAGQAEAIAPVDVLVNNAGICLVAPFLNIEADEWDKTLGTKCPATAFLTTRR